MNIQSLSIADLQAVQNKAQVEQILIEQGYRQMGTEPCPHCGQIHGVYESDPAWIYWGKVLATAQDEELSRIAVIFGPIPSNDPVDFINSLLAIPHQ